MKLKFGDLAAKAVAEEDAKNRAKAERGVLMALALLRTLDELPPMAAQLWQYPFHIRSAGIEACREANRRVRKERGEKNQA